MSDRYNLSVYDDPNNLYSLFYASNSLVDNYLFSLLFLFAGFIILFIAFKGKYDTIVSFMGSSFIISIVGIIGFSLGLVPQNIIFIPIFLLTGSIFAYMLIE